MCEYARKCKYEVIDVAESKTVLKRVTDEMQTGKFEINQNIELTKIKILDISEIKDSTQKYGKRAYQIKVAATHPYFEDMSFSFIYFPQDKIAQDFRNKKGHNICMGTTPHGEIKDIIIAAVSHESYAFQISLNRETWVHAERGPENGEYLLWHYQYYGRYSPRSIWRIPTKCEKDRMWEKHGCNMCLGSKCEHLAFKCARCGNVTNRQCPACKTPICDNHSHCVNNHYNLTKEGMFEGYCDSCRRKMPIGEKVCKTCGCKSIKRY